MNNTQTAVEWLYNQISFNGLDDPDGQVFQQAKAMEKEQIMDAFDVGRTWNNSWDYKEYYNEIYGKDN